MKKILILILFILLLLFSFLLPTQVHASSVVVINEVLYDPEGTDAGNEWLELKNLSTDSLNISGWQIQIAGSSFVTIYTFPNGTIVQPESFLTIGEANTTADIKVAALAMQNGGTATDGVRLVTNTLATIDTVLYDDTNSSNLIDDTGAIGTAFAVDTASSYSLCRKDNNDTDNSANDFVACKVPTLGAENILPLSPEAKILAPTRVFLSQEVQVSGTESSSTNGDIASWAWDFNGKSYTDSNPLIKFETEGTLELKLVVSDEIGLSDEVTSLIKVEKFTLANYNKLQISEVFPSPKEFDANKDGSADSNDEFVELVNISSSIIDLSGLALADESTLSAPTFVFSAITLDPGQTLVVFKETTKLTLNNNSDSIYLLGPDGQVIDKLSYEKAKSDISNSKFGDTVFSSDPPTPGTFGRVKGLATTGMPHPVLKLLRQLYSFYKTKKYGMLGMSNLVYTKVKWLLEKQQRKLQNQEFHVLPHKQKRMLRQQKRSHPFQPQRPQLK
jgi:hypothetical protein